MMKIQKQLYCTDDILDALNDVDIDCNAIDLINDNMILFENIYDSKDDPYLIFKIYKKHGRFIVGLHLTQEEKQYKYYYKDYRNITDYTNALIKFIRKYFKSLHKTWTRK